MLARYFSIKNLFGGKKKAGARIGAAPDPYYEKSQAPDS